MTMGKIAKSLCAVALALVLLCAVPARASAETKDTRTLAMINKPGVVMMYTEYTADMTWYEFTVDEAIL